MWLVFSVFDKAAEEYGQLYLARNTSVATRMFTDAVNAPSGDSMLRLHPEDYHLEQVGLFDEETGRLIQGEPQVIITAIAALRPQEGTNDGR